jgi:hypothetical protein
MKINLANNNGGGGFLSENVGGNKLKSRVKDSRSIFTSLMDFIGGVCLNLKGLPRQALDSNFSIR